MNSDFERLDAFKKEIEETEVLTQPLISDGFPFETLMIEYESADPIFIDKLRKLSISFKRYRKCRGDGNCFFRSFAFRLLEELCKEDEFTFKMEFLKNLWFSILEQAKFDRIAYEDFLDEAIFMLNEFKEKIPILNAAEIDSGEWLADNWRSNDVKSNTMVVVLRMITSAYLQVNAEEYLPFIYDFSDSTSVDPRIVMSEYCRRNVESIGVESDQIDIIALTKMLGCEVEIVYLDASQDMENMVMKFGDNSGAILKDPISLLYRPGHYDILYHE